MTRQSMDMTAQRDLTRHHEQLAAEGYTIVENLIHEDVVTALLTEVQSMEREVQSEPGNNRFEGNRTTRTYNLLARGDIWQQVPVQPEVLELIEGQLGEQCLVSSLASISLAPGESAQVIHADDMIMPIAKPHVATVANSMWALTDFTADNGATRLVPGSHLWPSPDYRDDEPDIGTIPAEMPAGSVLVWHGSTWHGGGANVTADQVRVGIAMNYCAGYIRQQENQQLGIPVEKLASFSPQLRQLCGLGMYRGLTGNIEKESPAHRIFGDDPETMVWDREPIAESAGSS